MADFSRSGAFEQWLAQLEHTVKVPPFLVHDGKGNRYPDGKDRRREILLESICEFDGPTTSHGARRCVT